MIYLFFGFVESVSPEAPTQLETSDPPAGQPHRISTFKRTVNVYMPPRSVLVNTKAASEADSFI